MPCRDGGPGPFSDDTDSELAKLNRRNNKLARLACEACRAMESAFGKKFKGSKELMEWWEKHKKLDEKRLAEEAKKKEIEDKKLIALSKLTIEEKKLLGLK